MVVGDGEDGVRIQTPTLLLHERTVHKSCI